MRCGCRSQRPAPCTGGRRRFSLHGARCLASRRAPSTRLAALGGIVFLCMVISTQPPWVPGAVTTMFYYQLVEIFALGVLLASGAGRWAGLDFFLRAWWARRRAAV